MSAEIRKRQGCNGQGRRGTLKRLLVAAAAASVVLFLLAGIMLVLMLSEARVLEQPIVATTQLVSLRMALEMYYADNGCFPQEEEGLSALGTHTNRGPYIEPPVVTDPWGRHFIYSYSGTGLPTISTLGADGVPGGSGENLDMRASPILQLGFGRPFEIGDAVTSRVGPEPTADPRVQPGTVLRILCDIPDDVGPITRTYPGRIDWPIGSESFPFTLSKETVEVRLQNVIPVSEPVRIFFIVEEDPTFPTRFGTGEWFWREHPVECDANTLCVYLSRFREAHDFARTRRP